MKTLENINKELENKVKILEDFIADLETAPPYSSGIEELSCYIRRGGKRYKLWVELHLNKYPGDY